VFHPHIARNLQSAVADLLIMHDRVVAHAVDCAPDLVEMHAEMATALREMAVGYKNLLRHVQAVNEQEPPAPAAASTTPAPTAPAAPAAAELVGVPA
jgi:hypothetical protein